MSVYFPQSVFDCAIARAITTLRCCCIAVTLLVIQALLLNAPQAASGRLNVGLGVSADTYQQLRYCCDNVLVKKRVVKSFALRGTVDFAANETVQLSGFGGHSSVSV